MSLCFQGTFSIYTLKFNIDSVEICQAPAYFLLSVILCVYVTLVVMETTNVVPPDMPQRASRVITKQPIVFFAMLIIY